MSGGAQSKVYAFGDSYTFGYDLSDFNYTNPKPSKLTYAALVAKHLKKTYECCAMGAYANNAISRRIIEKIHELQPQDIVLVMWTFPIRKEFSLNELGFRSISPTDKFTFALNYFKYLDINPNYLIDETLKEIYLTQQLLNRYDINYIFTSSVTDLNQRIIEQSSNLAREIDLNTWLFLDNNLGFDDWSRQVLNLKFRGHPTDMAHYHLAEKIICKLNDKH